MTAVDPKPLRASVRIRAPWQYGRPETTKLPLWLSAAYRDREVFYRCFDAQASERIRVNYHQGRMLDHVHLRVSDVEASKRFYRAVLGALNLLAAYGEGDGYFYADELYVDRAETQNSRVHLAFQAQGEQEVQAFYAAALAAGGKDNGAPGPRSYHGKYYAAFVLDPDGNNIEAVWHGPTTRSADSVLVERL